MRAHLAGRDDGLVRVAPLIERVALFVVLIGLETDQIPFAALREAESTGLPLGSDDFVVELERLTGRRLRRRKPGRKSSERSNWNSDCRKWVRCPRNSKPYRTFMRCSIRHAVAPSPM